MHKNLNEVVFGQGHANVLATHKTTLEFTKETHLSKMGDCIATVATDKAVADLNEEFKKSLTNDSARLTITIKVGTFSEKIQAHGSSRLTLTHRKEMVIRKSDYVCSRTLAVRADKAANELNRSLVEKLKDPEQKVRISLAISL